MAGELILSLPDRGALNMELDLALFNKAESNAYYSYLRLYSWSMPCVSLGYSQKINEEIDKEAVKRAGWEVVKRPTGGGIVFHNQAEVTYSFIAPLDSLPSGRLASYIEISNAMVCGLKKIGINAEISGKRKTKNGMRKTGLCFSYPAEYEILWQGRKLVGAAQKRGKKALLQQGSVFVKDNPSDILSLLKRPAQKEELERAVSVEEILGRQVGFEELSQALAQGFKERLGL